jgi:hypothetical protein
LLAGFEFRVLQKHAAVRLDGEDFFDGVHNTVVDLSIEKRSFQRRISKRICPCPINAGIQNLHPTCNPIQKFKRIQENLGKTVKVNKPQCLQGFRDTSERQRN